MTMVSSSTGVVARIFEGVAGSLVPYVGRYFDQRDEIIAIQRQDALTRAQDAVTRAQDANTRALDARTRERAVEVVDYLGRTLGVIAVSGTIGLQCIRTCDVTNWSLNETSVGCSAINALGVFTLGIGFLNLVAFVRQQYKKMTKMD